jgi:hypothetical protein
VIAIFLKAGNAGEHDIPACIIKVTHDFTKLLAIAV